MANILEERRLYPCIKTDLRIDVSSGISGSLLDTFGDKPQRLTLGSQSRKPEGLKKSKGLVALSVNTEYTQYDSRDKSRKQTPMLAIGVYECVDLSERGLRLYSAENIFSPLPPLQILSSDGEFEFKTEARLIWKDALVERSGYLYGVEFIGMDESQRMVLRHRLLKAQIGKLLDRIEASQAKDEVSEFFLKDVLDYISKIINLVPCLSEEDGYSIDLERALERLNTQILLKGYCLQELLSDEKIIQQVKDNFRKAVGLWAYKSAILRQGLDSLERYPQDFRIREIIYDNKAVSRNIGWYFDNYFLKSPCAVALRTCKDKFRKLLQDFISETRASRINILNIGCGSCREIRELLLNLRIQSSVIFSCIDGDEEALQFSQDSLSGTGQKNIEFRFSKRSVMDIINDEGFAREHAKQDLIYSLDLIDYLPDEVLKKLILVLYQLLQVSGKLILTHKNRDKTFPALPSDWFCDWKSVLRNREEINHLFYTSGISGFLLTWECDDFGYIYYFTITKG